MTRLRLGLLGAGIGRSMAPAFHCRAGELSGLDVEYDLLEHQPGDAPVAELLDRIRSQGYDAINVTYPYKEEAFAAVGAEDPRVVAMGAINTVLLGTGSNGDAKGSLHGHNTDYTGLQQRWRQRWPGRKPGVVAVIGAGGVGKAAAMAMAELGATEIRLVDIDENRSQRLRAALSACFDDLPVTFVHSAREAVDGADGVVNGTPVGMYISPGIPVEPEALGSQQWLFDAVYSPLETPLVRRATEAGLDVLNGFELFLGQALDAFELFTGRRLEGDAAAVLEDELWTQIRNRTDA